jgi:hypothetical protein
MCRKTKHLTGVCRSVKPPGEQPPAGHRHEQRREGEIVQTGMAGSRRRLMAPSMARDLGLRRARLRRRWNDETTYLLSDPANAAWIMDSIAELDYWRELTGAPPFDPGDASGQAP